MNGEIKINNNILNNMKTKALLLAALVGAAAVSANAGVRFGFAIGLPLPVVVAPPVVVVAPAPTVCVAPPVVVAAPPCPGVDYVWAPGYWSYRAGVRVWYPGAWAHRPYVARGYYGHDHGRHW